MISFTCPACNHMLSVQDELAGKRGTCPHCKKSLLVPAPAAATVPACPVAPAPQAAANPPPLAEALTAALPDDTPSSPDVGAPKLDFLAKPQAADELGRLGSYRVLKVLGAGGMGIVLLAEDPLLKRPVALKVMRPELAADNTARQRFLREAQATAAIDHHHIIHIYQVGDEGGVPFIAMPLLKGEPLDTRLKRDKRLSIADAVTIGKQIADGLTVAHKNGLIHRDIKPANIWLSGEPGASATGVIVKIVDFGLARAVAGDDVHLTQTGAILGTPAYMAPEQAKSEQVDFRCDLFSLGAVLYRMLTGELPFKGHDTMSLLRALEMDSPRPVQSLNADVPPVLAKLVMQLMAKELAQRPPTAKAVAEKLGEMAGDKTVMLAGVRAGSVSDENTFRRSRFRLVKTPAALLWSLRPWVFRRPGLAFAVAGVVLALLLLLISLPFMSRKQDVASREHERPENTELAKTFTNSLGMKFVLIPAGTFTMGSSPQEIDRCLKLIDENSWEKNHPLLSEGLEHEVEITQPFYLGATEVTVGQFRQFVEANPQYEVGDETWRKPGFDQSDYHPVVWVSWTNAVDFCTWLSEKEGKKYRLPTEAEWEYSCRAGTKTRFSCGDEETELLRYAWIGANSQRRTHPVGGLKRNPWGLFDMHGNVWEWCADWFDPEYYKRSLRQDPQGPENGERRVQRGGCWLDYGRNCRAAFRVNGAPGDRRDYVGFRVALVAGARI